ncbi:glycosyltransferase family 2 protein [Thermodesulfobacteriota bacterium]
MQVSVIIPTYNRAQSLKKAIDSVLAQSHKDFELIIVDDGSDDNTAELVEKYTHDIVYLKQKNRGPAAARNRGIERARYNLLAFLDSDDWFAENKLAAQIKAMQKNSLFRISHTNEIWYRNGQILNQKFKHKKNSGDIFSQSLQLCAVSMSTVMLKSEIFEHYGLFDEDFPCCEDYEFWLRVSTEEKFLLLEEPLTLKDGGRADQVSTIYRTGMDKFRIQAIIKILVSGRLNDHQTDLALNELESKCRIYGTGCIKHGRSEEGEYYLGLPEKAKRHQAVL